MSETLAPVSERDEDHGLRQSNMSPAARFRQSSAATQTSGHTSSETSSGSRGHHRFSSLTDSLSTFRRGEARREESGEIGSNNESRPLNRAISSVVASRLGRKASSSEIDFSSMPTEASRVYRRYRVGDPVLVSNHSSRFANLVNRYGFPAGEGITPEEQRGPYLYLLATVAKVHFEEDAEYYTVTRADTGLNQRADDEWIEPLRNARGEAAARRAATQFANVNSDEQDHENDSKHSHGPLYCLVAPFLCLCSCFYHVVLKRIYKCLKKCMLFVRKNATLCLNGMSPYSCSFQFTMVNFLVLCSIWYVFMDQARLAFFPPSADFALAVIDLIVWAILVLELICETFVRPDGYQSLLMSEKAYAPSTARFISRFHLCGEVVSLVTFVPEFVCLFSPAYECGDRLKFSLFNALFMKILGPTRLQTFYGVAFLALVRLRVFALVRHWKKMWINNTFVTMRSTGIKALVTPLKGSPPKKMDPMEEKEKDKGLTNASNIGTALMVINSHRALVILWAIMGLLPLVSVINVGGGANLVSTKMVSQLQAINQIVTDVGDENGCEYLANSLYAWGTGVTPGNKANSDGDEHTPYLLYVWVEPKRCPIESIEDGLVTSLLCAYASELSPNELSQTESNMVNALCVVWGDSRQNITDDELATRADIRTGAIQDVSVSTVADLTLEDGVTVVNTTYAVRAKFNQTITVKTAAFASFLLQVSLLICVLGGLTVLRRDATVLVLGPLRNMLKIVARYAKNPLAHTSVTTKGGDDSDDDLDGAGTSAKDELGNFETTQLIDAITKIADLLRKCWGVAGADVISTNLANQEGALTGGFNPTVPGKSVYALFGFAAIDGFSRAVHNLEGDVMILINDVAAVLHGEIFRWGFGDSGQCNKNLGNAFLMVYRIGLVKEVIKKLEQATDVVFAGSTQNKGGIRRRRKASRGGSGQGSGIISRRSTGGSRASSTIAMSLNLQSLPGISTFTDRAVIGMLKSYAGIYRDEKLLAWRDDFRLGCGVGAFSVNMFFGVDAGWAVEGAVGSEYKIDATYLSPHVNMASRMMSACRQYGVSILLSQAVQELMSSTARSKLRHLDTVTVKGSTLKQKIFTYDARHKGVDFFLFSRSDEQADLDAERYSPRIWDVDQDLLAMRQHVTEDFLEEFTKGRDLYLQGHWPEAIKHLERADEIMVENVMDLGFIEEELNELQNRIMDGEERAEEELRNETGDGPSRCLINFMKNSGGKAPNDWKGYRPLLQK